jgi:hypothetical protein
MMKDSYSLSYEIKGFQVGLEVEELFTHQSSISELKYINLHIGELPSSSNSTVIIDVISISGNGSLYVSQASLYPNKTDNEHSMAIANGNKNYTEAILSQIRLNLAKTDGDSNDQYVYISFEGEGYLNFQLKGTLEIAELAEDEVELIQYDSTYYRTLSKQSSESNSDRQILFQALELDHKICINDVKIVKDIIIIANSDVADLKICVQCRDIRFNIGQSCDFESSDGELTILSRDIDKLEEKNFFIIIKYISKASFPGDASDIEFSISVSFIQDESEFEFIHPGVFEVSPQDRTPMTYLIDLSIMQNSFYMVVNIGHPDLNFEVFGGRDTNSTSLAVISSSTFGFAISNSTQYRNRYCNSTDCKLAIKVLSKIGTPTSSLLAYSIDNTQFPLSYDKKLKIPNNLPLYFYSKLDPQVHGICYHTKEKNSQIFSKVILVISKFPAIARIGK